MLQRKWCLLVNVQDASGACVYENFYLLPRPLPIDEVVDLDRSLSEVSRGDFHEPAPRTTVGTGTHEE